VLSPKGKDPMTDMVSWGLIGLAFSNGISEGFEGQFHLVCFTAN